jgi:hypothetical protein
MGSALESAISHAGLLDDAGMVVGWGKSDEIDEAKCLLSAP